MKESNSRGQEDSTTYPGKQQPVKSNKRLEAKTPKGFSKRMGKRIKQHLRIGRSNRTSQSFDSTPLSRKRSVAESSGGRDPSCCPSQLLLAHEQERKTISRELHDVVAQHLTAILLRLAALKREAAIHPEELDHNITQTQQLVDHSVHLVQRFVRNMRPAMLDDLGLIPTLHSFTKSFLEETGIRVSLAAFAGVEWANDDTRTVLYRVVQEGLTNVARHARASEAKVKIQKLDDTIVLTIQDNGQGFLAVRVWSDKKNSPLGLLGMKERLEMVGGSFGIESTPGHGTTITAQIPLAKKRSYER